MVKNIIEHVPVLNYVFQSLKMLQKDFRWLN